jgi:hypothetical protein
MSDLYTEILDEPRLKIWKKLSTLPISGVLGGGTAIALQLGHRVSYDFDIFLDSPVPKSLLQKIKGIFSDFNIQLQIDSSDELSILISGVKLTFLYYPFPPLFPKIPTDSIPLFDLRDSAADKAYTIGRRGAWRDYFDLYSLCTEAKLSLEEIIKDAENKFGTLFNAKLLLEQLTYTDDITDFSIEPAQESPAKPEEIFSFFQKEVAKIIN